MVPNLIPSIMVAIIIPTLPRANDPAKAQKTSTNPSVVIPVMLTHTLTSSPSTAPAAPWKLRTKFSASGSAFRI